MRRLACLLLSATCLSASIPDVVRLWPGTAPGSEGLTLQEKITERSHNPARPDRIYTRIVEPSLTVHRPEHPNGIAVIVAPGGGYQRIVIDKEGPDTSAWLNRLGITAFVLKYRLPNEGHRHGENVPLADAQRAVRVLRAHAAEWGLDPQRIGFLGYSAGGHLAATVAFHSDARVYAPIDDADRLSARPDFSILGYPMESPAGVPPANLDEQPALQRLLWTYRLETRPGVSYPPTFLFQADDDPTVSPQSSARIYLELKKAHTPAELHIFLHGGHGFGIRDTQGPNSRWPDLCEAWMTGIGVLRP